MVVRTSPEEVYSAFHDMAFDALHNHTMPPKSVLSRIRSWDVNDPAVLEQARAYIEYHAGILELLAREVRQVGEAAIQQKLQPDEGWDPLNQRVKVPPNLAEQ